jgi:hypothetical protein
MLILVIAVLLTSCVTVNEAPTIDIQDSPSCTALCSTLEVRETLAIGCECRLR